MRADAAGTRPAGASRAVDRPELRLACAAQIAHFTERTSRPQGAVRRGRGIPAGGGQVVQPRQGLWLRQWRRRGGGRVRPHGDRPPVGARRAAAGPAPRSAGCAERQGPDSRRAARGALIAAAAALMLATGTAACTPAQAPLLERSAAGLEQTRLTIHSGSKRHPFIVEIARTPQEQAQGLMNRQALAPDRGMIFPYDPPQPASFWMKNTLIPLDII